MRTTLSLEDDVLEAARKLAAARKQPLGQVVSELMRRSLMSRRSSLDQPTGFPTFAVAEDSPPITLEDVNCDYDDPA